MNPFSRYQDQAERELICRRWLCLARDAIEAWPDGVGDAWGDLRLGSRLAILTRYCADNAGLDQQQYSDALRASVAVVPPRVWEPSTFPGRKGRWKQPPPDWYEIRPEWVLPDFEIWALTALPPEPGPTPEPPYPMPENPPWSDPDKRRPVFRLGAS